MKTPEMSNTEKLAFWQLPLASLSELARVLGTSPQQIGKIPEVKRYRFGGQIYCRPVELAHQFRALKEEVSP